MKKRKITITEVTYDDGKVFYSTEQELVDGGMESTGMQNAIETLAIVIHMMGYTTEPRFYATESGKDTTA